MAGLATLGEIVDYLSSQVAGATAADPADAEDVAADVVAATGLFGRFVVEADPAPMSGTAAPALLDGKIIVTDDGAGVATALVGLLAEHGVDAAVGAAADAGGSVGVIHLGNLGATPDAASARSMNRSAFEAAREFARAGIDGGLFVVVDDHHQADADDARVWGSGLAALARTAALEWPETTVRAISIEHSNDAPDAVAATIADELLHGGSCAEVRLGADGTRATLSSVAVDVEPGHLPLGPSDVIVVSGGGRGVTAATMIELARGTAATFVLLGRSQLEAEPQGYRAAPDDAALKRIVLDNATAAGEAMTPAELDGVVGKVLANREIAATIASIGLTGGKAHYRAVDITDLDAVEQALAAVRDEFGKITGIVHGAGVLADKLIADKTPEQFDRVFDTKVIGLQNLLTATSGDDLAVLCLFSSVAARTGNIGQADYAMANEVLNNVAISEAARRGAGCVVKSLGWGPWAGGMVTPALKRHFEAMGVQLIGLDVGARMLVDELSSPQTDQVAVVLGGGVLAEPGSDASLQPVNA